MSRLKNVLINTIPNPFSKESTLSDLMKKSELLKEGFGFVTIIKNVLFLLLLSFILFNFKLPISLIVLLIFSQLFITITVSFIKLRELKAIYAIDTKDNARSYWKILMTNEYFELIKYIFSLTVRISNIALVYIFFYRDLMIFVSRYIPFPIEFIGIFVLISIFFVILHILVMFYRYSMIKKLQKYDDLAKINLEYQLLEQRLTLIYMISAMSLILLVLFLIGLPSHILLIFCCISFIFFIISIIELKRTTNVSFDYQKVDPWVISHPIKEHQGEQLAGSVFGVLKVATGLGDFLKPFSSSFLGTGKTYFPENTMFITNLRIILIQIPISGGNKVVGEVDYVTNNFFYNRGELRQKGMELLQSNSLNDLLKFATNDVLYSDIKLITLKPYKIIIEKMNGEKLGYTFMDNEYNDLLKKLLHQHVKDKLVIS